MIRFARRCHISLFFKGVNFNWRLHKGFDCIRTEHCALEVPIRYIFWAWTLKLYCSLKMRKFEGKIFLILPKQGANSLCHSLFVVVIIICFLCVWGIRYSPDLPFSRRIEFKNVISLILEKSNSHITVIVRSNNVVRWCRNYSYL